MYDQYWCPPFTFINVTTLEWTGNHSDFFSFGICNEPFHPENNGCPDHYFPVTSSFFIWKLFEHLICKVLDKCVRISPYPTSFHEARDRCLVEGSDLASITNQEFIDAFSQLLTFKRKELTLYDAISDLWFGGISSKSQIWSWTGVSDVFSKFTNWHSSTSGDLSSRCNNNFII